MIPKTIPQVSCKKVGADDVDADDYISRFVRGEVAPLVPDTSRIITFDGFDGVGKSTLARHLAKALDLPLIQLDELLAKQQDRFLDAINFQRLSEEISVALTRRGRVIVEGCLVEAALDKVSQHSDFRIYVMLTTRMHANPDEEWVEEHDVLYGEDSTEELIANLENITRQWAKLPEEMGGGGDGELPPLEREIILYHRERFPQNQANIIVKIVRWT